MEEEIKSRLAELDKKMEEVGKIAKDNIEAATANGEYAREEIKRQVEEKKIERKGNIEAIKGTLRLSAERLAGKASSNLIKGQMNMDVIREKLAERKQEYDKTQLEKYIIEIIEYAEACAEIAAYATEEARMSTLEAITAQLEYEEKYGTNEEKKD